MDEAVARLRPVHWAHLRPFAEDRLLELETLASTVRPPAYRIVWDACPKRQAPDVFYALKLVLESVAILLSDSPPPEREILPIVEGRAGWADGRHETQVFRSRLAFPSVLLAKPALFLKQLRQYDVHKLTVAHRAALKPYVEHEKFTRAFIEQTRSAFAEPASHVALESMFVWVLAVHHTGERLFVPESPLSGLHQSCVEHVAKVSEHRRRLEEASHQELRLRLQLMAVEECAMAAHQADRQEPTPTAAVGATRAETGTGKRRQAAGKDPFELWYTAQHGDTFCMLSAASDNTASHEAGDNFTPVRAELYRDQGALRLKYLEHIIADLHTEILSKQGMLISQDNAWEFWCKMECEKPTAAGGDVRRSSVANSQAPSVVSSRASSTTALSRQNSSPSRQASSRLNMSRRRSVDMAAQMSYERRLLPHTAAVERRKAAVAQLVETLEAQLDSATQAHNVLNQQLADLADADRFPDHSLRVRQSVAAQKKRDCAAVKNVDEELEKAKNELNCQLDKFRDELKQLQPTLRNVAQQKKALVLELAKGYDVLAEQATVVRECEALAKTKKEVVTQLARELKESMNEALPAYAVALMGVKRLRPKNIAALHEHCCTLGAIPEGVAMVMEALCIIYGFKPERVNGHKPGTKVDDYRVHMPKLTEPNSTLLKRIKKYKKDDMQKETHTKLKVYTDNLKFAPANINRVDTAGGAICSWIRALCKYQIVYENCKPMRVTLDMAREAYMRVVTPLKSAKATKQRVAIQNAKIATDIETVDAKEKKLEEQANTTARRLQVLDKVASKNRGGKDREELAMESFTTQYRIAMIEFWREKASRGLLPRQGKPESFYKRYTDETCQVKTHAERQAHARKYKGMLEAVQKKVAGLREEGLERMVYLQMLSNTVKIAQSAFQDEVVKFNEKYNKGAALVKDLEPGRIAGILKKQKRGMKTVEFVVHLKAKVRAASRYDAEATFPTMGALAKVLAQLNKHSKLSEERNVFLHLLHSLEDQLEDQIENLQLTCSIEDDTFDESECVLPSNPNANPARQSFTAATTALNLRRRTSFSNAGHAVTKETGRDKADNVMSIFSVLGAVSHTVKIKEEIERTKKQIATNRQELQSSARNVVRMNTELRTATAAFNHSEAQVFKEISLVQNKLCTAYEQATKQWQVVKECLSHRRRWHSGQKRCIACIASLRMCHHMKQPRRLLFTAYTNPTIVLICETISIVFGIEISRGAMQAPSSNAKWSGPIEDVLCKPSELFAMVQGFDQDSLSDSQFLQLKNCVIDPRYDPDHVGEVVAEIKRGLLDEGETENDLDLIFLQRWTMVKLDITNTTSQHACKFERAMVPSSEIQ